MLPTLPLAAAPGAPASAAAAALPLAGCSASGSLRTAARSTGARVGPVEALRDRLPALAAPSRNPAATRSPKGQAATSSCALRLCQRGSSTQAGRNELPGLVVGAADLCREAALAASSATAPSTAALSPPAPPPAHTLPAPLSTLSSSYSIAVTSMGNEELKRAASAHCCAREEACTMSADSAETTADCCSAVEGRSHTPSSTGSSDSSEDSAATGRWASSPTPTSLI